MNKNDFLATLQHDREYAEKQLECDSDNWTYLVFQLFRDNRPFYYNRNRPESEWTEFFDFIDGNGFRINWKPCLDPYHSPTEVQVELFRG